MPALFLWFFGAAGAVIAAPAAAAERVRGPRRLTRVLAGLAVLLVAVTPLTVTFSQSRLNESTTALRAGDCVKATNSALGSLDALNSQAGAFEVLGWCDLRAGQGKLAIEAMRNAMRRDPDLALRLRARGRAGAGGRGPAGRRGAGAMRLAITSPSGPVPSAVVSR